MIEALVTRPDAPYYILGFVLAGIVACAGWICYLWWTQYTYHCGHTPQQACKCPPVDKYY